MGCGEDEKNAIWQRHRDQFPVVEHLLYLNHAAVAPLCRRSAEAMRDLAADVLEWGSLHYGKCLQTCENLRVETAKLIGAERGEIAIVKNTSEGIATIAMGIDWRPGDKIVVFREEFPANYFPWLRLEALGVKLQWLSIHDPLDRIDEAAKGARLLAISYVNYLNGHRVDLTGIGEICHRRGVFYFVDAIQGMGAFPIDVRASHIQALAADGHKWMLGPEGCGVLYIQQDCLDEVEPVEFGWTNVAHYADYASRDMTLRPDAGRYECGTLNTIGCFGLEASIRFLNEAGVAEIGPHVQSLGDRIASGATAKGYQLAVERTPATGAGIVSCRKEGVDSALIVARLREQGIIAAPRQGFIRLSPHFYISPGDIDRLLAALP